jgi:tetratricopeptide (TPR) repeat protein
LGRLFIAEENWQRALREFKRALASKPSPEAHYALGCLYYQLTRDALAARHLRKATEMDADYCEAFYVLGLIYQRTGQEKLAAESLARAQRTDPQEPKAVKGKNLRAAAVPVMFGKEPTSSLHLMTGGDQRLARLLRQDALNVFISADAETS